MAKHWEELTEELVKDCTFQEIQVYHGWLVVGEEIEADEATSMVGRKKKQKKRKKTISWEARSPEDCLEDLVQLSQELQKTLATLYDNLNTNSLSQLEAIFDIEGLVRHLCLFSYENGRINVSREARQLWDLHGKTQFANFFRCELK
jgi:hypothetical protein